VTAKYMDFISIRNELWKFSRAAGEINTYELTAFFVHGYVAENFDIPKFFAMKAFTTWLDREGLTLELISNFGIATVCDVGNRETFL